MYCLLKRNQRGQALIELALLLPFLLLLLLGIMEFGRTFHAYLTITYAAREGARAGALGEDDPVVQAKIATITKGLESTRLRVEISPEPAARQWGEELTIKVHYDLPIIMPLIGAIVPNPLPLEAATTMRIE